MLNRAAFGAVVIDFHIGGHCEGLMFAICHPQFHVNVRRSAAGSLRACRLSPATTTALSLLGTFTSAVKREFRSTKVVM
jgi:hypothetical protein